MVGRLHQGPIFYSAFYPHLWKGNFAKSFHSNSGPDRGTFYDQWDASRNLQKYLYVPMCNLPSAAATKRTCLRECAKGWTYEPIGIALDLAEAVLEYLSTCPPLNTGD